MDVQQRALQEEQQTAPAQGNDNEILSAKNDCSASNQFSGLSPYLVKALQAAEREAVNALLDDFTFPNLIAAPTPRELKAEQEEAYLSEYHQPDEKPLLDSLWSEPWGVETFLQKGKGVFWAYLLTAAFLFSMLWISVEVILPESGDAFSTQQIDFFSARK